MRRGILTLTLVVVACGGGAPTTTGPADRAAYCAVLDDATERGSEETMVMLDAVALPEVADLIDRLRRLESSMEDFETLAAFNDATCGVRWP